MPEPLFFKKNKMFVMPLFIFTSMTFVYVSYHYFPLPDRLVHNAILSRFHNLVLPLWLFEVTIALVVVCAILINYLLISRMSKDMSRKEILVFTIIVMVFFSFIHFR